MTVFALGVPCLINVLELNMNGGLHRMSSLHVVQNSKYSYTSTFILFFTSMKQDAQRRADAEIINRVLNSARSMKCSTVLQATGSWAGGWERG